MGAAKVGLLILFIPTRLKSSFVLICFPMQWDLRVFTPFCQNDKRNDWHIEKSVWHEGRVDAPSSRSHSRALVFYTFYYIKN